MPQHRQYGDWSGEATALKHLGQVYERTGRRGRAQESWTAALEIFERIGEAPEAAGVAAALSAVSSGKSKR